MMKNQKSSLLFAAISIALAIILGAFGAHLLKDLLSPEKLTSWKTGVMYQLFNSLGIIGVVIISKLYELHSKKAIRLLKTGIIFFSGSIYLLSLKEILHLEFLKFLGPITPIGGVLLITGWVLFTLNLAKIKTT